METFSITLSQAISEIENHFSKNSNSLSLHPVAEQLVQNLEEKYSSKYTIIFSRTKRSCAITLQ